MQEKPNEPAACQFNFEKLLPGLKEKAELLKGAGVKTIDELFVDIPAKVRIDSLDLPEGLVEGELSTMMKKLLGANKTSRDTLSFLGAGMYPNYVPAVVRAVTSRGEFVTSYTPYQAEVSQGMLQALWEFQSLMCELTGMEVTNTSMYDGPTAIGEAALMAARSTKRKEILVPKAMHWEKKEVLRTYTLGPGLAIKEVPYEPATGQLDLAVLKAMVNENTAALVVSNPNFFGVWEESATGLKAMLGDAMLIVDANPISLGIAKAPGDYGADIVVGEGQPLGVGPTLGGPSFGILTTRKKFLRDMPGRLIGMTKDAEGARAFCMTLQTREQHIRRGKATSNICTNQGLLASAATLHMALLGPQGLQKVALACHANTRALLEQVTAIPGVVRLHSEPYFHEAVIALDVPAQEVLRALRAQGIVGGVDVSRWYPELGDAILVCATETRTPEDLRRYAEHLERIVGRRNQGPACNKLKPSATSKW